MLHKTPRVKAEEVRRVEDVLLIEKENMTKGGWKLGRITYLNNSTDNLIRSVILRLPNGKEIVRPINLLYLVERNG